jgi:hypothetical protein
MKNQVTSIEQSKRLIELGVPAEKASMVWETDEDCARLKIWNTDEGTRRVLHNKYPNYYVPAFTVADLLEKVLPNVIRNAHNTYELTLKAAVDGGWRFCYAPVLTQLEADNIGEKMDNSLIELLCNRIEWAVSNIYGLNL